MRLPLLLLLIPSSFFAFAQGEIILVTGEKIPFTKIKSDDYIMSIFNGKEKRGVPLEKVYAQIESNGKTQYNKPNMSDDSSLWDWVELEVDGAITLYNKEVKNRSGSTTYGFSNYENLFLFAEKGKEYHNLFVTNTIGQNKKKKREILAKLVSDDPECFAIVQSEDFNYTRNRIVAVVRKYNENKAVKNTVPQANDSSNVVFYQRNTPYDAVVFINGNQYKIDSDNKVVIRLPKKSVVLACIDQPSSNCGIIKSDLFTKYYMILTDKENKRSLEISNTRNARFAIKHFKDF